MPLKSFTERHIVRLLATETRRTDTTPYQLSMSHVNLGRFLGGELVEDLPLTERSIQHPQGIRTGWKIENELDITLLPLMRAGLYTAEGIRECFPNSRIIHVSPQRGIGLSESELQEIGSIDGQRFVLIDSVVNTGKSIEPVIEQLSKSNATWIAVAALVTPEPTAKRLEIEYPNIHFYFARTSKNQYVGKGKTDTGNRLFGTVSSNKGV